MQFKGKLKNVQRNWQTGKYELTLTVNEGNAEDIQNYVNSELNVTIDKWFSHRTLRANAYCWQLLTKLADVVGTTKEDMYKRMIVTYSEPSEHLLIKRKEAPEIEKTLKSLHFCVVEIGEQKIQGRYYKELQIYRGSSTYDSKEMTRFVDGIVRECQDLGIETLPPNELERMKALWNR